MLKFQGQPSSHFSPLIGEITTKKLPFYRRHDKILVVEDINFDCIGYLGVISPSIPRLTFILPDMICGIKKSELTFFNTGDIVKISGNGEIAFLWEIGSNQNALLITEACNCSCLMCPQPPQKHDKQLYNGALRILDLLKDKPINSICITGGEPTIIENNFRNILLRCHVEHPEAEIDILTNAKAFSDEEFTRTIDEIYSNKDTFCISLHSDIDSIHDKIVGVSGSFTKTSNAIYNMAKNNFKIEIRHVITKLNYTRLNEFAEHLYRYFPFCVHYAFMSLEVHGLAEKNIDSVYIEPFSYKNELRKAILTLRKRGLNASIYNTPLCFCHNDIRQFARASISSWKNIWHDKCSSCAMLDRCSGFFSTSAIQSSKYIQPILSEMNYDEELIYRKPANQKPSMVLKKYAKELIVDLDMPILDVACGYGRNGAFLASYGASVIFLDKSTKSLEFIKNAKNISITGSINKNLITTLQIDLMKDDWPFEENSLSGIIDVHFYYKPLISKFISSLKSCGFLYFESVSAIGGNYLILPEYQYIITTLADRFNIIYYKEKHVKPFEKNMATLTLLARKLR